MTKPIVSRLNTNEQHREFTNRISDNLGNPDSVYTTDAPNNTGVLTGYTNTSDSYTHPTDQIDAIISAINNLNSRKVKRTGDTISGSLAIKQKLQVDSDATIGSASGNSLTIKGNTVTIPNGLNFDSNLFVIDAANNKVGVFGLPSGPEVLQVGGNTKITGTFQATGATQLDGNLNVGVVTINATTGAVTSGAITSTGSSSFGVLATTGDLTVNTNKFTVSATTGDGVFGGTITATGLKDFTGASSTTGKVLRSNGTDITYSQSTYPDTYTSGGLLYASSSTAVANFPFGTANQIIGTNAAGNGVENKTIVNGTGISVTHGAGTITINATGSIGTLEILTNLQVGEKTLFGSWNGSGHNSIGTNAVEIRPYSGSSLSNLFKITSDNAGATQVLAVNTSGDFIVGANKFTVAPATGNTVITGTLNVSGDTTLSGNITIGDAVNDTVSIGPNISYLNNSVTTTTTSAGQTLASFSASTYKTGEIYIQAIDSGNGRTYSSKIIFATNSTDVHFTEYGRVELGTGSVFDSNGIQLDCSAGMVYVKTTPSSTSSTVWKTSMTLMK